MAEGFVGDQARNLGACDDVVLAGLDPLCKKKLTDDFQRVVHLFAKLFKELWTDTARDARIGVAVPAVFHRDRDEIPLRVDVALPKVTVFGEEHLGDMR